MNIFFSLWFIFQEQKRLQEQFAADQEALYGSRSAIKRSPWVRAPVPIQYGDGLFFGYGGWK